MQLNPRFPNSATVHVPERLILRKGRWRRTKLLVRYGVFEHPHFGTCLIDTGYSRRVTKGRRSLPLFLYSTILSPKLTEDALPNVSISPDTILLTHIHADHISAIRDYPDAKVFAHAGALKSYAKTWSFNRTRHGVFMELLPRDIHKRVIAIEDRPVVEGPLGLPDCFDVFDDGSILAVPLPGHMRGHLGFVFPHESPSLLYAGDVSFLHQAVVEERMPGPPARWILDDVKASEDSARRVADFAKQGGRVVYCHDPEVPE